jgi:hypothetical protein
LADGLAPPVGEATIGEGELPPELDRINWAVVMFGGGPWALLYGAWGWFAAMALVSFAIVFINISTAPAQHLWPLEWRLLLYAGYAFCSLALTMGLAFRANRHVWRAQRDRLAGRGHIAFIKPSGSVEGYLTGQVVLAWLGAVLGVIGAVWGFVTEIPYRHPTSLMSYGCWAVVVLSVWLYDRSRRSQAQVVRDEAERPS